jgi:hypothetical protein
VKNIRYEKIPINIWLSETAQIPGRTLLFVKEAKGLQARGRQQGREGEDPYPSLAKKWRALWEAFAFCFPKFFYTLPEQWQTRMIHVTLMLEALNTSLN